MFDPKAAQEMAKQFVDSLPSHLKNFGQDMENYMRQFMQQCFSKMDLVTKEEFETQTQVLLKTRAMVEDLEKNLQALESKVNASAKR